MRTQGRDEDKGEVCQSHQVLEKMYKVGIQAPS